MGLKVNGTLSSILLMNTNLPLNCRKGCGKTGMRHSIAAGICGIFLVAFFTPSALANTDYTYAFTANPGQVTWYNGTTIEIQVVPLSPGYAPPPDVGFLVVSLDFHGVLDLSAWAGDPPFFGPTPASMTPFTFSPSATALNESFSEIASANASGWEGAFSGYGAGLHSYRSGFRILCCQ
jgi:hypothetical protein